MILQIDTFHVKSACFDRKTYFADGVLHINRTELRERINQTQFAELYIDLAFPGESCRISRVGDVIQPRVKPDAPEQTFPGMIGEMAQAGAGRTVSLDGFAVIETWEMPAATQSFIDMSGPGAFYTPFSGTINLVISAVPEYETPREEYAAAIKRASLGASVFLASQAIGMEPDEREVFEFSSDAGEACAGLPRVAYIYQIFSHRPLLEPLFYGDSCRGMLPTAIQPTEILDGALINYCYEETHNLDTTYTILNHPVIRELMARNGKDLVFAGVILKNAPSSQEDKNRMARMAATQAKYLFNADAVILTKEGGGHPQLDLAICCEQCEKLGVRTVLLLTEFLTTDGDKEETLIFNNRCADAIVSAGYSEMVEFPPVEKVYGGDTIPDVSVSMHDGFSARCKLVRGSMSQLGDSRLTSREL